MKEFGLSDLSWFLLPFGLIVTVRPKNIEAWVLEGLWAICLAGSVLLKAPFAILLILMAESFALASRAAGVSVPGGAGGAEVRAAGFRTLASFGLLLLAGHLSSDRLILTTFLSAFLVIRLLNWPLPGVGQALAPHRVDKTALQISGFLTSAFALYALQGLYEEWLFYVLIGAGILSLFGSARVAGAMAIVLASASVSPFLLALVPGLLLLLIAGPLGVWMSFYLAGAQLILVQIPVIEEVQAGLGVLMGLLLGFAAAEQKLPRSIGNQEVWLPLALSLGFLAGPVVSYFISGGVLSPVPVLLTVVVTIGLFDLSLRFVSGLDKWRGRALPEVPKKLRSRFGFFFVSEEPISDPLPQIVEARIFHLGGQRAERSLDSRWVLVLVYFLVAWGVFIWSY